MLRPITCNNCPNGLLGWFETTSGCLHDAKLPDGMKVFGAYLVCSNCRHTAKFDGERLRRQHAEQLRRQNTEKTKKEGKNVNVLISAGK